ncbi:MAG: lipopolysaccharide heptosyltransferase II [Xanthobacteraceae bacterium]
MNLESTSLPLAAARSGTSEPPILLIPYVWIGDFVRCHSVVKLLRDQRPERPVDVLTSTLCAPLLDYMPGVRKGIVWDLPRRRIAFAQQRALAERLRRENYGSALVMLRTWKSALAPFLARIPRRTGFVGEARFLLLNDLRWGERRLERMIDRCGALALPKDARLTLDWPLPELVVPADAVASWQARRGLSNDRRPVVTLAPGAVGTGKAWPVAHYCDLARRLAQSEIAVWVLGGPNETALAHAITEAGGAPVRDLTGPDLRDAILALKAANAAVTNDSGLMHIAAAIGTPTIAVFGPTSPRHWAPLNPLAATLEPPDDRPCPQCGRLNCDNVRHRRTQDVAVDRVYDAVMRVLHA